jgi:hypothetical protein
MIAHWVDQTRRRGEPRSTSPRILRAVAATGLDGDASLTNALASLACAVSRLVSLG